MCVYMYILYIHTCVHTYNDPLVVTAPPQTNTATTSTRRQQVITAPQQVTIQETTTDPADQGHITAPPEQPPLLPLLPLPPPQSTGINVEQERIGMYACACIVNKLFCVYIHMY